MRFAIGALVLLVGASPVRATPRATNLSQSPTESGGAVVAAEGSLVVVAWIESENLTDGLRATIVASRSIDGGDTFSAPTVVAALTGFAAAVDVKVSSGVVHLVWLANSFTIGEPTGVDYVRSTDGGASFEPIRFVNDSAPAGIPAMAVDGSRIAVVWTVRGVVYLARSSDAGSAFELPVTAAEGVVDGTARTALTASSVATVWIRRPDAARSVVERRLIPVSGSDAPGVVAEVASTQGAIGELVLDSEGSSVVAVWIEAANGSHGLTFARSVDDGMTFRVAPALAETAGIGFPRLTIDAGIVHIAFVGASGRLNYFTVGPESETPRPAIKLGRKASFADLSARDGVAAAVWTSGFGRSSRLEYAVGDVASGPGKAKRLTRAGDRGAGAQMCAEAGVAFAVWTEPVGETRDVFFARVGAPWAR
ncbi:MAG TPA: sialidase family protein [Blastocatellia bacterium]|nr:sialidase family protein [Blastocatellia bacterium]